LSRNGETYRQKSKCRCNYEFRYIAFHEITLTDTKNGPCSARSDSHHVPSLGCLGPGVGERPNSPMISLRRPPMWEAYAATQVAAIGPRYKFGTGPKSTGPDLEKNENWRYNENVN